jgi:protoheme IX farnesyltransferase
VKAGIDSIAVAATLATRPRTADFFELTKPRITFLVVVTTLVGFYAGAGTAVPMALLFHALAGTGLVASGASAFNMYLERHLDARMRRTENRPLPAGRLHSGEAFVFALLLSLAGMLYLVLMVNLLTGLLSALTFLSYLFVYTPLKTRTWFSTLVGAAPGALPTLMGWSAVTGGLSTGGWVLFSILFVWQLPHFYAIGWMHRDDYARAGFSLLPVVDETGERTSRHTIVSIVVLMIVTLLPTWIGLAGWFYFAGAMALGVWFLAKGITFVSKRDFSSARRLFLVSVCYLPLLLILLMLDKTSSRL